MHDPVLLAAVWTGTRLAGWGMIWGMKLTVERSRVRLLGRLSRAAGPNSVVARRDGRGWLVIVRGEGE